MYKKKGTPELPLPIMNFCILEDPLPEPRNSSPDVVVPETTRSQKKRANVNYRCRWRRVADEERRSQVADGAATLVADGDSDHVWRCKMADSISLVADGTAEGVRMARLKEQVGTAHWREHFSINLCSVTLLDRYGWEESKLRTIHCLSLFI